MTHTVLIRRKQNESNRQLDLVGTKLIVLASCHSAELKHEGSVWICRRCEHIDAPAVWNAIIDLDHPEVRTLPAYRWDEWFKFWFGFEGATIEVTW